MIRDRPKLSLLAPIWQLATTLAQTHSLQPAAIAAGPLKPDWNSLTNHQRPEWYRDAQFGILAHWCPQSQPEHGAWYARGRYQEDGSGCKPHLAE